MIETIYGKKQRIIVVPIKKLVEMYEREQIQLRIVNQPQVRTIKQYLSDNLPDGQVFIPPLVATTDSELIERDYPTFLIIVDGNQRVAAISQLYKNLEEEGEKAEEGFKDALRKKIALDQSSISIQVIGDLDENETDQLYIDLNRRGKKVALSKRIEYDSRDLVNVVVNNILSGNKKLRTAGVEREKRAIIRPSNKNFLSLSQLREIVELFSEKSIQDRKHPGAARDTDEDLTQLINAWLDELFKLYPPSRIGDFHDTMLALFPLVRAIAVYAVKGADRLPSDQKEKHIRNRMRKISHINWEREQLLWTQFEGESKGKEKYYYLAKSQKAQNQLVGWLEQEANLC